MANLVLSRSSIPQSLVDAKKSAIADFFTEGDVAMAVTFLAHPNPRHNVMGIGLGRKLVKGKLTGKPCVRFYVERKLDKQAISKEFMLPQRVGKVDTDVIETGRFWAYAGAGKERSFLRPARPGCSIGFAFTGARSGNIMAGTFGAVVESGGKRFILSNNHVLAHENALPVGSIIFQPGLLDKNTPQSNRIGKLSKFVTLETGNPNRVDCAIAEVLENNLVSPTVLPKVNKLKSGQPVVGTVGMRVEKTGRTTGYTSGTIQDISADVKVGYDLGTLTFADQIIIVGGTKSFSDAGDSGSLIVEQKSKRPVGLLFAGSDSHTIANHIEDVLQQLNVSIVA